MRVELENLKGISNLEFDIPGAGLWLLTGLNGSGKTSLLAALYRIRHGRAFQDHYKTTAMQEKLDTFKDAKIRYKINGQEVTYSYGGKRWPPTPRSNANILSQFPYPSIHFVQADGSRVEAYAEEIIPRRINQVNNDITDFLTSVLHNNKWNDLKFVNTRRGTGNQAFLLPYRAGRETHYYSEKNFSLGELCVLKLAQKMSTAENNSLILIDEVEMALHPQAQVRLLNKITQIATNKNLTVIFSTHSSTLIKNIDRRNIIFISRDDQGSYTTKTNVFPAQVLGEIAFDEEVKSDFIFFVEDEEAKLLLEQVCGKFDENRNTHKPMYKVVPVGGYYQVMQMLERSALIIPTHVKRHVFLDDDVRTEAIPAARRNGTRSITDLYDRVMNSVSFLPCTPEIGVTEMLEAFHSNMNVNELRVEFYGTTVNLDNHIMLARYQDITGDSPRKVAKSKLDSIVEYIFNSCGTDETTIRRVLYRKYIDHLYSGGIGSLMALLGPVFNAR
ncbi:MAG: ATP-binding protein [Halomonas sp.]|nr:AAA family ATPase [Halomonas sp.]MBF60219.1 ATP-binding protein [Halomonas sp.]|tara:strand:+ start:1924 stop:3426 length:1503 start_codon:yes stop_codon:yes gene_type:complete